MAVGCVTEKTGGGRAKSRSTTQARVGVRRGSVRVCAVRCCDAQAEVVETKGEAWDDVEVMRNASKKHAKTADAAKADYEAAKADLLRMELGLREAVKALNADFEAYNQTCATEG